MSADPKSDEQFESRAFTLLQGAEAELRGAAEERRTYTKSLDTIQFRMSRMDMRAARTDANVMAIVKHFGIKLPNSTAPSLNGSQPPPADRAERGSHPDYDPDEEVTLAGRRLPVTDNKVALTKSDFEMLKRSATLARIGLGIGEKILIAAGAAVLIALATLAGAWVHSAYIDAKHVVEAPNHTSLVVVPASTSPAADKVGPAAR
jgi:hypothetical protein